MIHLNSIELVNFKGITRLTCDFHEVTVLAGLNNSGKTTILQAVYLLVASLPRIAANPQIDQPNRQTRVIGLDTALSPLGLRDTSWLSSVFTADVEGTITGRFANSLQVELGLMRNAGSQFVFTLSSVEPENSRRDVHELLGEASRLSAAILTPPGEVPSHEVMVSGDQYQGSLRQGEGAQRWRNGIWWGIQTDGFESFAPVQERISKYFPNVKLLLPTLAPSGSLEILIKYMENGKGPLDIAQSGAGLRTFISLARILEQSSAEIILLDEPDAHLHASQQAVVLDLMLDLAARQGRQVVIATHSPEIISRVPIECLRWLERTIETAQGGEEVAQILERLGASPEIYFPHGTLPEVLVYVEGLKDRPIVEALIKWCRQKSKVGLPSTLVIPHKDGRFEAATLQGIARFAKEFAGGAAVVGVRDRDWYYGSRPPETPEVSQGDGWWLITLPCKEMENLFCDAEVLFEAYDRELTRELLQSIIDEESKAPHLVEDWRYLVRHRIRDALPKSDDPSTRERKADEMFASWSGDSATRRRLVAGKELLRQIRNRVGRERSLTFYPSRVFEKLSRLPPAMFEIAKLIFPTASFDGASHVSTT